MNIQKNYYDEGLIKYKQSELKMVLSLSKKK